jgi:hypothetical protein
MQSKNKGIAEKARDYAARAFIKWRGDLRANITREYIRLAFLAGYRLGREVAVLQGVKRGKLAVVVPFKSDGKGAFRTPLSSHEREGLK